MQKAFVQPGKTRPRRPALIAAAVIVTTALAGCNAVDTPPATVPASGVTSSNGGGMRATGAIPDVSVSNGTANVGTMSRNPRVPTY